MKYKVLRDFISQLEKLGELKRVTAPVSTRLEMTEICDRVLRAQGPAILFENVIGHTMPVLANLFGTPRRVALGMGEESTAALREVGKLLAYLKEPEPPKGLNQALAAAGPTNCGGSTGGTEESSRFSPVAWKAA